MKKFIYFGGRAMVATLEEGKPVRFAPLGDPVEIKVRGYNLTLRKNEAEQILVIIIRG